nr:RNA-directed DNA polymerase, eukaryota, reverse transcriptase zinc-binding domain protein [Tanacetum cinerariifolium]
MEMVLFEDRQCSRVRGSDEGLIPCRMCFVHNQRIIRVFGLILCNGDKESLDVVKKALNEFSSVSGLLPNLNKSTIFFGSIDEGLKRELLQILPLRMGSLLMRYLGVPLIEKKLGVKNCKCIMDNVEKRINNYRNKLLSYAGRIQLIASVLSSLHQYWALVYILLNTMVKDLNKLFKRFLWSSGDSAKGKARVSWNMVCRPKDQGGLGITPLDKWNEVLLNTQVWKIIKNKESLWVKWVNTVKLKGNSFWEIESNASNSWGWKSMLYLRDKMKPFVSYKIGNGRKTSLWGYWSMCCVNMELSGFPALAIGQLLRMDLNENKSFTSVLVMPSIRASLPIGMDPVGREEEYAVVTLALLKSSVIRDVG